MKSASRNLIIFTTWLLLFLTLASRHTPWRDEYQSWLVSTETQSLPEFFRGIRYERHPPLYYIALRSTYFATHAVSPSFAEQWYPTLPRLVSGLFSIGCVALLVFEFSTFGWPILMLPFSILFLLEYGIISRCYSMGVFFLLLSIALERRSFQKLKWVSLIAAAATHLYFTLFVGVIFLWELWQTRRIWISKAQARVFFVTVGLSLLGLVFLQRPPAGSSFSSGIDFAQIRWHEMPRYFAYGMAGLDHLTGPFRWNGNAFTTFSGTLFALGFLWSLRDRWPLLPFVTAMCVPLLIMGGGYAPYYRHTALFFVFALYFTLAQKNHRVFPKFLAACVVVMVFTSARWLLTWVPWERETRFDFSGSHELVASLANELKSPESVIVTDNEVPLFSVMGLIHRPVYNVTRERLMAYPYFVRFESRVNFEEWCQLHRSSLPAELLGKKLFFVIERGHIPPAACGTPEKIFENHRSIMTDEMFAVFQRRE